MVEEQVPRPGVGAQITPWGRGKSSTQNFLGREYVSSQEGGCICWDP